MEDWAVLPFERLMGVQQAEQRYWTVLPFERLEMQQSDLCSRPLWRWAGVSARIFERPPWRIQRFKKVASRIVEMGSAKFDLKAP
jgi:hypothetical protein